ncbi:hypothetical protein HanIR_Chr05g0220681 [Helianthus annuus]|nr:hypothetical protein HanIR_Chr05g0220681 [Helianthus annuus]KAJ0749590.1 hypothetical protein HanLR1_Chr05g0171731 [Helianthus annuus]
MMDFIKLIISTMTMMDIVAHVMLYSFEWIDGIRLKFSNGSGGGCLCC